MTDPMLSTITDKFLFRGDKQLAGHPNFKLVGRTKELQDISAILMQSKANSLLLYGPGGVGCSSLALGLQASKKDPDAPFDIVSKRLFWLSVDGLFSSGEDNDIHKSFQVMIDTLNRTPDSVLIIEETKDFIEAARNSNSMHFINALMLGVKNKKFQVLLQARDVDLEPLLKCHSDVQENFTIKELTEPTGDNLLEIVKANAIALSEFHGIRITESAYRKAIELTNKYRVPSLDRAQPERAITVIDRAFANYRLWAHQRPIKVVELESRLALAQDVGVGDKLRAEIKSAQNEWQDRQDKIKKYYFDQRQAEVEVIKLEQSLAAQLGEEAERRQQNSLDGNEPPQNKVNRLASLMGKGGFDSPEVTDIKSRIAQYQTVVTGNKLQFDALTLEINKELELNDNLILKEFSNISGIDLGKLNQDERAKLLSLESNMKKRIFGQDRVVHTVCNGIKVFRLGRSAKEAPLSYLFMGPSGVGKTEMAKAIAAMVLDDEKALTRFDMSEYMEKHAVAKMIGAPPGYELAEVGGILTNAARANPRRVYLFDEIEKAHPDIFNIFLQILDDGRLTDAIGRTARFGDAIIVMTTNIGQAQFLDTTVSEEEARGKAMEELKTTYRGEFLNRFNGRQNIHCFSKLDLDSIEKIVDREIRRIDALYGEQGIHTIMEKVDLDAFCKDHYQASEGARGLPGYIKANLEPVIVNNLLEKPDERGTFKVTYNLNTKLFETTLIDIGEAKAA